MQCNATHCGEKFWCIGPFTPQIGVAYPAKGCKGFPEVYLTHFLDLSFPPVPVLILRTGVPDFMPPSSISTQLLQLLQRAQRPTQAYIHNLSSSIAANTP